MKKIFKKIFMFIYHPLIFFRFTVKNNLFVGKRANIKNLEKLKVGNNISIGYDIRINFFGNDDTKLIIGDNVYICHRVSFIVGDTIMVGKNTVVASDVCFVSENHRINLSESIPYQKQELIIEPIKVGENCWIGEKVIILPGVEIGDNVVIGAGSVVTKSIPDNSIAVGNPARIIKTYDFNTKEWKLVKKKEDYYEKSVCYVNQL